MPFLQIAIFDATRAERDDGEDDRLLYQEHFRVHDRPEYCGIMADVKPTDLTGWFLGLSSLAPHFGASDKSALRFVCSEKSTCATLNPCEEVWIALAFVQGSPVNAENNNNNNSDAYSIDANNFASQVFRDVSSSSVANFFRSHLRALENLLRSVCGSPPLWGGQILIPKPKRKEMLKKGLDLNVYTDDPPERPADPEKFREICDLFGCHLAKMIGSMHQSVKKGSDACSTFFGFPTIRSSVKIALGTGGRARISKVSDGTNIPVVLLIDGMLAISATTDSIARNLVLVNNLFPSHLKDGSIFYSYPNDFDDEKQRREYRQEQLRRIEAQEIHPGLFNPDGKPEAWKVIRSEIFHSGIQHLAIGLVSLDLYNDVEKSTPILKELKEVIDDVVTRSFDLTNVSSVLSYKNAPRFRFKDPSLQFSWSAPGYGSGSSSLFGASSSSSSSNNNNQQQTTTSSTNNNNNNNQSPSTKTSTAPSSSSSRNSNNNNNIQSPSSTKTSSVRKSVGNSSSPLPNRALISSVNQKMHYDFSSNCEKALMASGGSSSIGTQQAVPNGIVSPRNFDQTGATTNRGMLTSPGGVTSPGGNSLNATTTTTISSNNNIASLSAPTSSNRQALIPLLRACCTLTCQMATLTERALDNAVGKQQHRMATTSTKEDQEGAGGGSPQPQSNNINQDRTTNPIHKLGIPEDQKPFSFDDFFSNGPNIFVDDDDLEYNNTTSSTSPSTRKKQGDYNTNNNDNDNDGSCSTKDNNNETSSSSLLDKKLLQPEDKNWMSPVPDLNSKWFSKDDLTYKVDDYSWATIKVIGGRAVGVMVLCSEPNSQSDPMSIEELIHQSNAISLLTFDDVHCTTYDYS